MTTETIITLVTLGVVALSGVIGLIIALVRGDIKKFIISQMEIAEQSGMKGAEKLAFVLKAVKDKYKIMEVFLNAKKFVEYIISISKGINYK